MSEGGLRILHAEVLNVGRHLPECYLTYGGVRICRVDVPPEEGDVYSPYSGICELGQRNFALEFAHHGFVRTHGIDIRIDLACQAMRSDDPTQDNSVAIEELCEAIEA